MSRHIDQFESLRGMAALWVAASHALLICEITVPVLSKGGWAVDIFIVLSGFVITLMQLRTREAYAPYLLRRAGRLYPLYLVALGLGLMTSHLYGEVIGPAFWNGEPITAFTARAANEQAHFWSNLGLHLTMLHGVVPDTWIPQAALAFSGPLWSISLEWQFYLVAPLLIVALDVRQRGRWIVAALTLAFVALLFRYTSHRWFGEVWSFLPLKLPFFCFGVLCALMWESARRAPPWVVAAALVVANLVLLRFAGAWLPTAMWSLTYFVVAMEGRLRAVAPLNAALSAAPLRWIGQRSYGLYILHMPMLLIAGALLIPHMQGLGQYGTLAALIAVVVLVVLPLADVCYRYVEMPMNRRARDLALSMGRRAEPAPLAGT